MRPYVDGLLDQGPLQRGDRLRPGPAARGWRLQRGARGYAARAAANGLQMAARGQPVASPQGATDYGGDAHGGAGRRGGRPLAEWLLAVKGSRRLRRGSSDGGDDAVRVKEG
ncbi:hypothetical protein GW17_00047531 [Ensete ventricosum]|nr:hypothetical protein GW17_00047531 [Ensete ventricosum]